MADKYCTHEQNIYEGSSTGQNQLQWYDKIGGYTKVSTEELSRDKTFRMDTENCDRCKEMNLPTAGSDLRSSTERSMITGLFPNNKPQTQKICETCDPSQVLPNRKDRRQKEVSICEPCEASTEE
jgi:hypothetical protein